MQKTLRPAGSILSRPASRFGKAVNPRPALLFPSSFNYSLVQLFNCSIVLPSRVKMKIFTLIELLIMNTCQIYIYSKG